MMMMMIKCCCFHLSNFLVTVTSKIVQGVETVDSSHFITQENIERLKQAKEANRVQVFSSLFWESR